MSSETDTTKATRKGNPEKILLCNTRELIRHGLPKPDWFNKVNSVRFEDLDFDKLLYVMETTRKCDFKRNDESIYWKPKGTTSQELARIDNAQEWISALADMEKHRKKGADFEFFLACHHDNTAATAGVLAGALRADTPGALSETGSPKIKQEDLS